MPTGYTHKIKDGQSFKDFVMGCARAFGALVMMRDEPHDAPIPERFEPSDYHKNKIIETERRITELENMSIDDALEAAENEHISELRRWQERESERTDLRNKYNAMMAEVVKWQPPTPEHQGLKDFMIEQIETSRRFDCSGTYDDKPKPLMPSEWKAKEMEKARRDIDYHTKEHAEEVNRTEGRNNWIKALRESL